MAEENGVMLTSKKAEELFYNALCNAVGTGYMNSYGITIDCESKNDYRNAYKHYTESNNESKPCMEDVWMEALKMGLKLKCTDLEDNKSKQNCSITLEDVHKKVQLTPIRHLADALSEDDDAVTADVIIQIVFFGDIIYG